jgi:hypothetical protein
MKFTIHITIFLLLLSSCANMVAPTGGEKDSQAPEVLTEKLLRQKGVTSISYTFNEYVVLNKWEENFYISPPIKKRIQKKIKGSTLHLTIEDSLAQNTTYNIALNKCIKDLNEGNILDTLHFIFSTSDEIDTLTLNGKLQDSYTLDAIENTWIMLFEENRNDSIIFKDTPNYIAKTDKNGNFHFPNLNEKNYTIVALTDFDFIYNEEEKIAFHNTTINAEKDSFISLLAFDPIVKIDSTISDTTTIISDSLIADTLVIKEKTYGNLVIITAGNNPCIFQILQNNKVIKEYAFVEQPFNLTDITPGKYQLKYITDSNMDGEWTTGNWESKTQAEQVINYPSEITIRANWDFELEWIIGE